ncbi:MAG TPA: tRNA preQ1(34) S-adenosylmethionine ribosyltransferase-isomerase QueA [Anaerolineaceae bacterium]|nr:tRNA preQ1(34) S-adenosylmethionine ribosyltransferase-isomerase QueA [Anaerolineaceae bacterium]
MQTSDFDYHLPLERIAQTPLEPRHNSRLMVMHRNDNTLTDSVFHQLGLYLRKGDLLVINQTRVIPARLFARKKTGGKIELLLLKQLETGVWEALVGGKGLRKGVIVTVEGGPEAEIIEELDGSQRIIRFLQPVDQLLAHIGQMPLPPYIHEELHDPERYQTVYAAVTGSAAAPTAGLHFTPWLINQLEEQGIQFARVTLHVGLDTFAPVNEEDPLEHRIHTEWCEIDTATAERVNQTRAAGGRVIAVGTTSVRTLESAAVSSGMTGQVAPYNGQTGLFILPGYEFKIIDGMITNFHLPRSTLLMLVSAFAGRERILNAYQKAIERGYRFYSFGDAMLIV